MNDIHSVNISVRAKLGSYSDGSWEYPEFQLTEFRTRRSRYCICIFVFNENKRLQNQLKKMQPLMNDWDVIIADGNSTDGCNDPLMLRSFGVRSLLIRRESGQLGSQMRMAFAYAMSQGYQGVVTVDGNDKDNVNLGLPRFVQKLDLGFDHIQGSRFIRGGYHANTPLMRLLGVKLVHAPLVSLAAGYRYTDTTNGFRAYSRKLIVDERIRIFRHMFIGYELHYYIAVEARKVVPSMIAEVPVSRTYPAGNQVPTKIHGITGNLKILSKLFAVVCGHYSQ
jgi:glycosyltransferase involved in cell wall biosynthesis